MVERQDKNEITLRCKMLDPNNPTMLSCRIVRNSVSPVSEESVTAPTSDQSMSDARITPSYDAGDPRKQDYEEFIVRKVERDGKTVFEPTGPSEGIDPRGKEIMTPDETQQPDLTKVSSRLSGLKTCDGRKCFVSKPVLSRRDKPGSRNETKGDGE